MLGHSSFHSRNTGALVYYTVVTVLWEKEEEEEFCELPAEQPWRHLFRERNTKYSKILQQ